MADVTPILIKDLAEQTTAADTDYMVIGGADAKKIKWSTIIALIKAKLGGAATKSVANNLTTASAGSSVLDAYQGKLLNDKISELNTKITAKTLCDSNWSGLHIKVFQTLDGIFFGIRGTLTQTLAAGTKYQIDAPNMIAMLSGSFETHNGMRGFMETDTGKLYITPNTSISGWVIASGVLIYGM